MKYRYISIAGTMGVGKTTMVKIIAEEFRLKPIYERFSSNPFLPKFYKDMKRWAFHSQTFFLVEKISQLKTLQRVRLSNGVVQDTPIYQDVFSYAKAQQVLGNMSQDEWNQYLKLYQMFKKQLQEPDLIIFLSCPVRKIYDRIVNRKRNYETGTQKKNLLNYLSILDRLNRLWLRKSRRKTKIVTIETDSFNYLKDQKKRDELIKILKKRIWL